MSEPTCWARSLAHLLDWGVARGADREALLSRVGVLPALLADPDARVPARAYYDAVEAVADALRRPSLGLDYIETVDPSAIDAIGYLAASSATLGEAFRRILRHHHSLNSGERFEMEERGGTVVFRFVPWGPLRPAHAYVTEMYAADCLILPARFTGTPVEALSLDLSHAALGPVEDYRRRFGRVPRFGAPRNTWSIPASTLARPLLGADAGLVEFFERYLARRDDGTAPPESMRARARGIVEQLLPDGGVGLAPVAARLRLSRRTLQRRLAAEGTSIEALREEVRRELAVRHLERGLPIAEVSYLLGYAEPSVFHRAFRRWTGLTPRAFRAGAAVPPPRRRRRGAARGNAPARARSARARRPGRGRSAGRGTS